MDRELQERLAIVLALGGRGMRLGLLARSRASNPPEGLALHRVILGQSVRMEGTEACN